MKSFNLKTNNQFALFPRHYSIVISNGDINMKILGPNQQPLCRALGATLAITEEDTVYEFIYKGKRYRMIARKHFIFDGASIPRIVWTLLGLVPHGSMDGPGLGHDYGYHFRGLFPVGDWWVMEDGEWVICTEPMSRRMCDDLIRALCLHFEICGSIRAFLVWSAVRTAGRIAWVRDDMDRKMQVLEHIEIGCAHD
jgi:hypothetical protein